jgi:hypothetical protein
VNNKSAPIPEGTRGEVERLLRRMGYRLVLRQAEHPRQVNAGRTLPVALRWENVGVAPPYGDYRIALRLAMKGSSGEPSAAVTPRSIRSWQPGITNFTESLIISREWPGGDARLAVAVVHPPTRQPAVRLAIEGRADDGWYPLGAVAVRPAVWAFRYNRERRAEMAAEEAAAVERNSLVTPPLVALQPQDPVFSPATNLTRVPPSAAAPGTASLSPGQVGVASPALSVPTALPEGGSVVYATNYAAAIEEAKRRHRGAAGATNLLFRGPGPILGPPPPRQ